MSELPAVLKVESLGEGRWSAPHPAEGSVGDVVPERRGAERTEPLDHVAVPVFRTVLIVLHTR